MYPKFLNERSLSRQSLLTFTNISKKTFLSRKTIDNRWGDEPDWYIEHIWENHFQYGMIPNEGHGFLQLDGEASCNDDLVKEYLGISK